MNRLRVVSCINKFACFKNDVRQFHVTTSKRIFADKVNFARKKATQCFDFPPRQMLTKPQIFDYFLVLDFEANCDAPINLTPQEIIEFPVLKVSGKTFKIESTFHSYVRPKIHAEISSFCTQLTGIVQDMVDVEPYFEDVYVKFNQWMQEEGLLQPNTKFSFVTCGEWDLKFLFQVQCKVSQIPVPEYMTRWINIKTCFAEMSTMWPQNLTAMLDHCELKQDGHLHSGIDDCKNIANILKDLAYRGYVYQLTSFYS